MKSKYILPVLVLLMIGIIILKREKKNNSPDLWGIAFKEKCEKKRKGISSNKEMKIKELQKYFRAIKTKFGEDESGYPANYLMNELNKLNQNSFNLKSTNTIEWVSRGPGNVCGRIRSILLDPDDNTNRTWYAGSATGGVWKTTDAGETWENISEDIPYLAASTLALSISNPDVIYLGTGESFPGSMQTTGGGIFKSSDKGINWTQLSFTASNEDFRYVNRIVVDPNNPDVVIAATTSGIFKSIDGGENWTGKYLTDKSVEDLKVDTSNFNTIYAGVNTLGVLRSTDAGETWDSVVSGIALGYSRFEIAISPTNTNIIYCSVNKQSDDGSDVYVSTNQGDSWELIADDENLDLDILGGQGDYDNTIAVHPFSEDTVFVGGVNIWKIGISSTVRDGQGSVSAFDTINTGSFLNFIPFTGNLLPGMNIGTNEDATDIHDSDFVSIEIRFGNGLGQKAHRFFVPEEATSGVPAEDYSYQDYVDVPFEVWDVTNNKQLMCSFRDQERDGEFNLYERSGELYGELGREYLFIHAVEYDAANPNTNIATQGGRSYKMLYFFWPTLTEGATWVAETLPDSKISIEYFTITERVSAIDNVSDAYSNSGNNRYRQDLGKGETSIPGFHPDHHVLIPIPFDKAEKTFWLLNGNDGGLGISYDNGVTFEQIKNDMVTTQFYGVAKKPYRDEYIGGMQDNGTWQSAMYKSASLEDGFYFRIGGDGFETVWNLEDTNKILASIYNNQIQKSVDHGITWSDANSGMGDDGPFLTKLTMIPSNPKKVFAIGTNGLYYTGNFATTSWRIKEIGEGWVPEGSSATSQHNIEYSIANDSILWAGAAAYSEQGYSIFVSLDQGNTFNSVNAPSYEMPSFISGIATHPTDEETAYLLYSLFGEPKIMRTTDLGNSWEDITGFEGNDASSNGFPDVGCLSLFVFPDAPDTLWAGTEIGIVESTDNGTTWHLLQSSLPNVPIWQIFMQDNQIVVATYGRGIWTYQYGDVVLPPEVPHESITDSYMNDENIEIYPNPIQDYLTIQSKDNQSLGIEKIQVIDMKGSLLIVEYINSASNRFDLDMSDLSNGEYILLMYFENSDALSEKILIQH